MMATPERIEARAAVDYPTRSEIQASAPGEGEAPIRAGGADDPRDRPTIRAKPRPGVPAGARGGGGHAPSGPRASTSHPVENRDPRFDPRKRERARDLYEAGFSEVEVAEEMELSRTRVRMLLDEAGVKRRPPGRPKKREKNNES